MSKQTNTGKPRLISSALGDGSIRVRHREFIRDITGQNGWTVAKIEINPGLTFFTWLSALANLYESYVFNSLSFDYESSVSTTTNGTVMLSIDFDAGDSTPLNKQEMMAMQGAVRSAPWAACNYNAAAQNLKKFGIQRYTRTGPIGPNLDIKTYDVGNLFVATQGTPVETLGELYVTYDITLHTPQPNVNSLLNNFSCKIVTLSDVSNTTPFGTGFEQFGGYPLRYKSGNEVYFDQPGQFLVTLSVSGTGIDDADVWAVSTNTALATLNLTIEQPCSRDTDYATFSFLFEPNQYGAYLTVSLVSMVVNNFTMRVSAYKYSNA